ncbi:hypothetical protein GCM10011452_25310 [Gemmobacter lanyuensis]|uniref:Uncharacterized protein n=1 Tax=Gemmobacter lanyuensis TaxID=1054497 RepID=A0A918MM03_9RHOB|nr:hypothetical protein [Gemmobacter lanyuensis]GGW35868.1 hypothetical protein GCM10011452_25310 [Gemmobacter lanyuensis]
MPKLVRLYITNVAIGYGLSAAFVALLVGFDIANLGHLVLETEMGWLAALMMFVSNGVVFAGAQFAIAVMRQAQTDDGPHGGTRAPALIPVRVEAKAQTTRRVRH